MYCPRCGAEQANGGKFCHKCGHIIASEYGEQSSTSDKEFHNNTNHHNNVNNQKKSLGSKYIVILLGGALLTSIILISASFFLFKNISKNDTSSSKPAITTENENIENQLRLVIDLNLKAMEEENLDQYMSTIIVPRDQVSPTEETLKQYFRNYDLKYTIEDFKILTTDKDDAQVKVVQKTEKLKGLDFRDNRVTAIHHLRLINGQWKIFKSDTKNIEYIDGKSNIQQEDKKSNSLSQDQGTGKV